MDRVLYFIKLVFLFLVSDILELFSVLLFEFELEFVFKGGIIFLEEDVL